MKSIISILALLALFTLNAAFNTHSAAEEIEAVENAIVEQQWVDSIFNLMTLDERIGQLMSIRAHSDKGSEHIAHVENMIKKYHVGGLTFFQGDPVTQARLINQYQKLSKHIPLMIAMDAEWGLGMRMKKTTISFPRQLMLGAIQDNRLLYDMGTEIGQQLRRAGVHLNFAPVMDVNNNAANPVINTRSFGEDRYNVTVKGYMYMQGMKDYGVMASAKHFPGHGDTDVDSHHDLPIITHPQARLDSIELYPFRALAQHGVGSMMVAHLNIPTIDDRPNLPTTLSRKAITDLLRKRIGFDGLIFTDGLEMEGVTKYHKNGEVEAKALAAGNDVLLLPRDLSAAFREIKRFLGEGKIDQDEFDTSVKRVLRAKYRLELTKPQSVEMDGLMADLNNQNALALKRRLIQHSLTLVRNPNNLVPFQQLDSMTIASLAIGSTTKTTFQKRLDSYIAMEHFNEAKKISSERQQRLINKLKNKDVVIVSLHDMSSYASRNFGLTESLKNTIAALEKETKVVLVVFGNPYSLKYFDAVDWLMCAYDEDKMTEDIAAQALFGAFPIQGRLPVTASKKSAFNMGVTTNSLFRLGYDLPESVGLNSAKLTEIDGLAKEAIEAKATPGCVVLVAKDGKVVFNKAYGYHTYSKKTPMTTTDIFDLASVTKIAAATLSTMKLYDEGKVNIYQPVSKFLPDLQGTNKSGVILGDMMAHRAGLKSWLRFYEQTISDPKGKNPKPLKSFYKSEPTPGFSLPVTEKLYLRDDFADSIRTQIRTSPMRSNTKYVYSDLGFYLIADMVKAVTGEPIDDYLQNTFYKSLGLQTAGYNPWKRFSIQRVPPTENDNYFRAQKVQGYVHDMGAAMLGGVSGHAGLFANSNDLAIIMQMLLNRGYYGGKQYISPKTVFTFTTRHPIESRRGIGFDMKETNETRSMNMSPLASDRTFGHLGFTGICSWVDPEHNLIYLFLSNRTYPSMRNNKLGKLDFRPRIQSVIYEAMGEKPSF